MKKLMFLPLVALGAPVMAAGFAASDLAGAAQTSAVTDGLIRNRLNEAAEALRLAIALDPAKALAAATPEEAALLKAALAMGDAGGDLRARWFMAGASRRSDPEAMTSLFYNPLARGWLIIKWTSRDGKWVVGNARLAAAGPAEWVGRPGPYLTNFITDYRVTEPTLGEQPGAAAGIEAGKWITGVAMWMRDPAKAKAANMAHALIAAGDTAKLGGGAIDMMPGRVRATFWPIAGFSREGGAGSLIYGSALHPQILIAADFEVGAAVRLVKLTLINLDNVGAAK